MAIFSDLPTEELEYFWQAQLGGTQETLPVLLHLITARDQWATQEWGRAAQRSVHLQWTVDGCKCRALL